MAREDFIPIYPPWYDEEVVSITRFNKTIYEVVYHYCEKKKIEFKEFKEFN